MLACTPQAARIPPRPSEPSVGKGFSPHSALFLSAILAFVEFRLHRILHHARESGRKGKKLLFYAQYQRIATRRGKNRATIAVAHSILTVIWHLLKHNVPYRDLGADYYDGFHREHKIKAYLKRLQALGWEPQPPAVSV